MATNNLFAEFNEYFVYSKICPCHKEVKNSKIHLSFYDENGSCILSKVERKKFSFTCLFCETFNEINFEEICNKYTVQLLKRIMKKNCTKIVFKLVYILIYKIVFYK